MFLFEEFKYNDEEAKKLYGESYYRTNWYLEGIITDYEFIRSIPEEDRDRFHFAVNKFRMPDNSVDNLYKIGYAVHYAYKPNPPFQKDQIDYLKDKLSILGDAVKIIIPNMEASMIIQYFIEKDEYRWNKEQAKIKEHEDKLSEIEIPEPSLDSWLFMLDAQFNNKNPHIIFKKFKDKLDQQLEYLVIAYKLKWGAAAKVISSQLYHCFGDGRFVTANTDKGDLYAEATKKYAEKYMPDEDIADLINEYNSISKSANPVPTKGKYLASKFDVDSNIKTYSIKQPRRATSYDPVLTAEIKLANGKTVHFVVTYNGIYIIRVYRKFRNGYYGDPYYSKDDMICEYMSPVNIPGVTHQARSNHLLKDTIDLWYDKIMNDIMNDKK